MVEQEGGMVIVPAAGHPLDTVALMQQAPPLQSAVFVHAQKAFVSVLHAPAVVVHVLDVRQQPFPCIPHCEFEQASVATALHAASLAASLALLSFVDVSATA